MKSVQDRILDRKARFARVRPGRGLSPAYLVRLLEVWKAIYQEDYCLKNIFERVENKSIGTRSSSQIKLKTLFKTRLRETSYQLPSVLLWNAAPPEITEAKTESQARAAIRNHVKNKIPI